MKEAFSSIDCGDSSTQMVFKRTVFFIQNNYVFVVKNSYEHLKEKEVLSDEFRNGHAGT